MSEFKTVAGLRVALSKHIKMVYQVPFSDLVRIATVFKPVKLNTSTYGSHGGKQDLIYSTGYRVPLSKLVNYQDWKTLALACQVLLHKK